MFAVSKLQPSTIPWWLDFVFLELKRLVKCISSTFYVLFRSNRLPFVFWWTRRYRAHLDDRSAELSKAPVEQSCKYVEKYCGWIELIVAPLPWSCSLNYTFEKNLLRVVNELTRPNNVQFPVLKYKNCQLLLWYWKSLKCLVFVINNWGTADAFSNSTNVSLISISLLVSKLISANIGFAQLNFLYTAK